MANYTLANLPSAFSPGDTITFSYTGSYQILPFKNQTSIKIDLWGGRGGDVYFFGSGASEQYRVASLYPYYVSGIYNYTGNELLYVYIGENGHNVDRLDGAGLRYNLGDWTSDNITASATFNGGAAGLPSNYLTNSYSGYYSNLYSSGGGCTDIRTGTDIATQLLTAGGSGGCFGRWIMYEGYNGTTGTYIENSSGIRLEGKSSGGGGGYYGGTSYQGGVCYYDASKIASFSKTVNTTISSKAVITILGVNFDVSLLRRYII